MGQFSVETSALPGSILNGNQQPGDLFNEIAPFYLFQVDHAAWARLSEQRLDNWSLYLNLLHVEAARGVTGGALREALFGLPDPAGAYDLVPGMIWNQVLRPLCWVGLLKDITTSEHAHVEDRRYVTTPLWAKAFEYTPAGAKLSVLAAHRFRQDHPVWHRRTVP